MTSVEMNACVEQVLTDQYAIYQGDACELIRSIPTDSIHYGIHSPPFIGLYKFSRDERDLSNSEGPQFWQHYAFLIAELLRVTVPGRLHSVHVMQLPTSKRRDGFIGMRDFRGEVVRAYEDAGWHFHSEVCIWKDPVGAMTRTKSIRLLHKQIVKDSSLSGQAAADYVLTFRKPGDNPEPITGQFDQFVGTDLDISREAYQREIDQRSAAWKGPGPYKPWPYDQWASIMVWQRYASPVWGDIDQHRTLQNRRWNPAAKDERDEQDEQHISPLQLDVIERCVDLWSTPGDTVLTPFLGIGSEVWAAVNMGRRGVGFELKPSYFAQAARNLAARPAPDRDPSKVADLFPLLDAAE